MEFEVRGKFLDNSKAFDKIWHDGLIFKIHHQAIRNVSFSENFAYVLDEWPQRVFVVKYLTFYRTSLAAENKESF